MIDDLNSSMHPAHLADLRKSGLSNQAILDAGIRSVPPRDIDKIPGYATYAKSAYEIPYPEIGYSRYKMFYDEADKINPTTKKSRPKYLQKKGSMNHLYIPPKAKSILSDPAIQLYITEGEKKALKACQEGLHCVGLSGLWNWSAGNKELIKDFDLINFTGRTIYIVPDSDWLQPNKHGYGKNLKQAVYGLAEKLKGRSAKVFVVQLPEESEVKK